MASSQGVLRSGALERPKAAALQVRIHHLCGETNSMRARETALSRPTKAPPVVNSLVIAVFTILYVGLVSCVSVQRTIGTSVSIGRPEKSKSTFEIAGGGGGRGATEITIRPSQSCSTTETTTTTTTKKVFKKMHALGAVLGAALLTSLVFSLEPESVEEKWGPAAELCETVLRDYIYCNRYFEDKKTADSQERLIQIYQGSMVAADLITVWRLFRAGAEVRRTAPVTRTTRESSTQCAVDCDPTGKHAYLRVAIKRQNWCLDLGRIGSGGTLYIPPTFQLDQAARLPKEIRGAFLSEPMEAVFFKGEVVVPECGEPHDCLFWAEAKK